MRKAHWWGLGALVGTLGLVVAATAQQVQRPAAAKKQPATFEGRMLAATKMQEQDLRKFLTALGPAVSASISAGQSVTIPGLGTFRVVQIPEHRDMASGGRPVVVSPVNYVEFVPAGNLTGAANAAGATPAVTVPQFQYVPLPDRVPGNRNPGVRVPNTRQP